MTFVPFAVKNKKSQCRLLPLTHPLETRKSTNKTVRHGAGFGFPGRMRSASFITARLGAILYKVRVRGSIHPPNDFPARTKKKPCWDIRTKRAKARVRGYHSASAGRTDSECSARNFMSQAGYVLFSLPACLYNSPAKWFPCAYKKKAMLGHQDKEGEGQSQGIPQCVSRENR